MNITGKLSYEYTLFDVSFLEKFLKVQMNSHWRPASNNIRSANTNPPETTLILEENVAVHF